MVKWHNKGIKNNNIDRSTQVWKINLAIFAVYMYSIRKVIMYNCHLAWWSGAIQRMLFSNIHWKVLYPAEQEEAWNFKTSFKRGHWHLLVWINREMIEKARQDLGTNRQIIRQISIRSKQKHTLYTTRRAWRHTFRKSDRRFKGLSTDVNECWPISQPFSMTLQWNTINYQITPHLVLWYHTAALHGTSCQLQPIEWQAGLEPSQVCNDHAT